MREDDSGKKRSKYSGLRHSCALVQTNIKNENSLNTGLSQQDIIFQYLGVSSRVFLQGPCRLERNRKCYNLWFKISQRQAKGGDLLINQKRKRGNSGWNQRDQGERDNLHTHTLTILLSLSGNPFCLIKIPTTLSSCLST